MNTIQQIKYTIILYNNNNNNYYYQCVQRSEDNFSELIVSFHLLKQVLSYFHSVCARLAGSVALRHATVTSTLLTMAVLGFHVCGTILCFFCIWEIEFRSGWHLPTVPTHWPICVHFLLAVQNKNERKKTRMATLTWKRNFPKARDHVGKCTCP